MAECCICGRDHCPANATPSLQAERDCVLLACERLRAEVESLRRERDAARQVVADHDRIAIAEVESLRERIRRLEEALAFAASVIKSGEPWTETCERVIWGALATSGEAEPNPQKAVGVPSARKPEPEAAPEARQASPIMSASRPDVPTVSDTQASEDEVEALARGVWCLTDWSTLESKLRAALSAARRRALEEAAVECEERAAALDDYMMRDMAERIRALASREEAAGAATPRKSDAR